MDVFSLIVFCKDISISKYPDQMPHSAASELDWHCLTISSLKMIKTKLF